LLLTHLILTARSTDKLNELKANLQKKHNISVEVIAIDLSKKNAVEKVSDFCNEIDILINNAANDPKVGGNNSVQEQTRFENFSMETWDKDLAVGLTGAFLCSQVLGSEMAQQGRGVIVNISSDLGIIAPDQRLYKKEGLPPNLQPVKPVTYSVVKTALVGLTRYLATYWAEQGIRVNALCPGGVVADQPEGFKEQVHLRIPMGRMAQIDEYRGAVLFLVSDASSYMTGTTLSVDGGRTCW
jgi:NAD(P)-dependent dehydrogenase (short-subunit alcohol dehydrogenase family)